MLYASLKAAYLLAVVVWIGGMFFVLACLRPAVAMLEPAQRAGLMLQTLRRFLACVGAAVVVILGSGATMVGIARASALRSGLNFNMPLDWYVMAGGFVVMLAVFVHIRFRMFRRLVAAADAGRWPDAATALGTIRIEVLVNLVLGVFVILVATLGQGA
ncbi:MAG: CopD family protein [Pseudomonadota bacterium]|nr:CopD family protein [Pseudomonadota bacterium]